ncbi:peptidoglycan-binding LysM domain-containing protein [Pochonia chlamydosporia 170]|uniref:Peptidoglycan-binding LysM domain-containing protein n=1 Tax=Pochonia chlamydosporia 170 TaxID=1380566 RepID=A0A179G8R1_METCM|nr:peptidoglycan-binding LysM domain-containing protein [Pochonia chlamydosporia 170]OAQ74196.1 peptidoglycan-binding LysM domain-containing protein [Pochonia chlamydosporia 170]
MSRFSRYDTDEERLPEGMTRVGYDADTQVYTFKDADGSYWESAPGCQYGQLTRVGDGHPDDASDTEPFLSHNDMSPSKSWRTELMPLLNFGVIIGVALLGLFWYLHYAASGGDNNAQPLCHPGTSPYAVRQDDTCWAIGHDRGISVDDILRNNKGLDCDRLNVGSVICLPD